MHFLWMHSFQIVLRLWLLFTSNTQSLKFNKIYLTELISIRFGCASEMHIQLTDCVYQVQIVIHFEYNNVVSAYIIEMLLDHIYNLTELF